MALIRKGWRFYAVISVPSDCRSSIGRSQIWRSLNTGDKRQASIRYCAVMLEEHNKFQYLREVKMNKTKIVRYRLKKVDIAQQLNSINHSVSSFEYTEEQCSALAQIWARRQLETFKPKEKKAEVSNRIDDLDEQDLLKIKLYQEDYDVVRSECLSFLKSNKYPVPSEGVKPLLFKAFLISKICVITAIERHLKSIKNYEVRLNSNGLKVQVGKLTILYGNPEAYVADENTQGKKTTIVSETPVTLQESAS